MKSQISALMDGELDEEDAASIITQLKKTEELRDEWAVYHLIGDAMGRPEARSAHIARRVSARLAVEPTVLAPRPQTARHKSKAYAVAASVAAVAAVGWISLQTADRSAENLAASQPAPVTLAANAPISHSTAAAAQTIPVISVSAPAPAQINHYLLAHGQFSPNTAMHGVAPYMRTVAEPRENSAR
ncbi:anti-sigma 24 factor [Nitrosospira lacus]|uniref:Anti sigma-E protein RseA N-terminal domain-containing protein n=1 Tax=Nitrosospira lacus TaxID=1288494 RepID=A0A1W6SRB0_9PROT|nr:sigma-E factor negative regulatory protein [Nitrosospira lacus]ARO88354.1 anti-sigma 24 factor [Nitrosospira lacus]